MLYICFRLFSRCRTARRDVLESIKKLPNLFKNYNPEEVLSRLFKVPAPTIREFMKLVEEHTGDVKNITCPTLILHGDKDDIVPYDSLKRYLLIRKYKKRYKKRDSL